MEMTNQIPSMPAAGCNIENPWSHSPLARWSRTAQPHRRQRSFRFDMPSVIPPEFLA
ncbi:MAG TPA: hypothetical protein PLU46_00085 [Thiotrichales bacterium]|nr:hypothetical protein [Thiotrichales bacterium]